MVNAMVKVTTYRRQGNELKEKRKGKERNWTDKNGSRLAPQLKTSNLDPEILVFGLKKKKLDKCDANG